MFEWVLGLATIPPLIGQAAIGSKVFNCKDEVFRPPKTSIILPTLNEERFVESTLKSLMKQNVFQKYRDRFELMVVDGGSRDATCELVKKYCDRLMMASKGKLTGRDLAVKAASGDVIVAVDADTFYPCNWLNLVLQNFSYEDVVAVGTPRLTGDLSNPAIDFFDRWRSVFEGSLCLRLAGSNSAFLREAYFESGGFDLSTDQTDIWAMVLEEELKFAARLDRVGKVVYDWQAPVFTSARRMFGQRTKEDGSFGLLYESLGDE